MGVGLLSKRTLQHGFAQVLLVLLTVALGAAAGVAPSGAASSSSGRGVPVAVAARTLSLNLSAKTHLVGRPGRTLNEQGTLTGTLSGTAYTRSTAISSIQGTGTFTFYPKGGSLSGRASTHARVVGATVYFSGTARITGGSGTWAHVSSSSLQYSGTMDRQNYRVIEHISGSIHY
jgi:hypothetical protein